MARSPASDYTARQAATLLGLTEDAIRKRVLAGRLDGRVEEGAFVVSAEAVESERRELLQRLNAVDARGGTRVLDTRDEELKRLREREEVELLREELIRSRAAYQSLIQAQASLTETVRGQLDAIQQLTLPGSPRSLMDTGSN